jgi:hypothetical protein
MDGVLAQVEGSAAEFERLCERFGPRFACPELRRRVVAHHHKAAIRAGAGSHDPLHGLGLAAPTVIVGLSAGHRVLIERDELALQVVVEHCE